MLAAGEEVAHRLEIGVLDGRDAIHAFKRAAIG
jgi:hypothetical protein